MVENGGELDVDGNADIPAVHIGTDITRAYLGVEEQEDSEEQEDEQDDENQQPQQNNQSQQNQQNAQPQRNQPLQQDPQSGQNGSPQQNPPPQDLLDRELPNGQSLREQLNRR
jgi:FtsZ-interacting cell division protein YlmF